MQYIQDEKFYLKNNSVYLDSDNYLVYIYEHPQFVTRAVIAIKLDDSKINIEIEGIKLDDNRTLIPILPNLEDVMKDYENIQKQLRDDK